MKQKLIELGIAVAILLSPIGVLEISNHLRGGDNIRPWVLDDNAMSRAQAKELLTQSYEQQIAKDKQLDERMFALKAEMEERSPEYTKRERKNK